MSYYERVNDFRINLGARKKLGQGSQGAVYPGISLITKDPVAAKRTEGVCKEYFNKDEFEKEADLLLNRIPPHENIIKVLDFTKTEYEDKGIPLLDLWLITELCEFGNLKEFAFQTDLSIEQKIELMYQSALAVRHLHGCKPESVAHRDVKPENILLTGNEDSPTVKLCDFGSAKSVTHKDGKSVAMWSLAGTGRYQAPEQVESHAGQSKYDKLVDIFSLGITFLALLKTVKGTLMSPETINNKGLGEIMWIKHKNRQAFTFSIHKSSDSAVVRAVKDVIKNMIWFEPSSRLSAAEVVEELSKLRKGHLTSQLAPATVTQPPTAADPQPTPATDPQPAPAKETWLPGTKVVPLRPFEARHENVLSFEEFDVLTIINADEPNWYQAEDQSGNLGWIPSNYVRRKGVVPGPASATFSQPAPATDPQPAPVTDPQPAPATDPQPAPANDPPAAPTTDPPAAPTTDSPAAPTTDTQAAHVKDLKSAPATDPHSGRTISHQPALDTDEWQPGTKVVALFSFKAADDDNLDFRRNDVLTILKSTTDHNWYQAKNKSRKIGMIPRSYVRSKREIQLQLQPIMWMHGKMPWRKARALLSGKDIPESMTSMEINALSSDKDVGTFLVHEPDDEDKMVIEHVYTLHVVRPDGKVGHYRIYNTPSGQLTISDLFSLDNIYNLVKLNEFEEDTHGLHTTLQTPFFNPEYLDFVMADWNISQSEIDIRDMRYGGTFTDTYTGEYLGRDVFIRKRNDPYSVQDILIEAAVMSGLSHKNLVQLIGVVLGDETLIVTEFLSKGRLNDYLLSQGPDAITSQDQMSFARDVCSGMQYLEQNEIVHRKLMAQSILLSKDGAAKVGDFTFAHPIGQCKGIMKFIPRWNAPEVSPRNIFTTKSDMWSFGVLLWEIYSFGSIPYPGILYKDLHSYIMDGGRMEAPDGCPDEIYHVMLAAWDVDPDKRPTFSDVCKILDKLEVDMYMTCMGSLEEDWIINRSEVHILDNWYTGEFADTYNGEYSGREVFIRKRKDPHSVQDARIEAAVMTGLSHKNLVQLIGVVLEDETLIVTEFLSKGRLDDYLLSQGPDGISSKDQMSFARDVCHGMKYLEQTNIVHRNLLARSVLLSEDGTAKVGDFILAHPVGRLKAIKKYRVKWSAPEVLERRTITCKSDVWSFGVLLWEIYSYGLEPYNGIPDEDIYTHIMDGGRLEAPDGCPDEIYHVMLIAWNIDPAKRPTFSDVCEILDSLKVPKKQHRSSPLKIVKALFRR